MKLPAKIRALMAKQREAFVAAKIVETNYQCRDHFARAHAAVSVELCHGSWCTFARYYAGSSEDPYYLVHGSRDAARGFARAWLSLGKEGES